MKKRILYSLFFLMCINFNLVAQVPKKTPFERTTAKATALLKTKKYQEAAELYEQALNLLDKKAVAEDTRYAVSVAWALAGDKEKAFEKLYELVKIGYYTEFKYISQDERFQSLYGDKRWEEIKRITKQNTATIKELIPFYQVVNQPYSDEDMLKAFHQEIDMKTACMIPYIEEYKWGFVSKEKGNKVLLSPIYEQVVSVHEKGAIVLDSIEQYGLVQPNGNYLIPSIYLELFREGEHYRGLTTADDSRSLEGVPIKDLGDEYTRNFCLQNDYYDEEGKLLFSEKAHDYVTFIGDDELAWFRFGKRYRIRNRKGKLIKEFKYGDRERAFIGISDDLLIYALVDQKSRKPFFVAENLAEEEQFRLPIIHYNEEKSIIWKDIESGQIRGVYQLSPNLYGWQPMLDYEMHFMFTDGAGNDLTIAGEQYILARLFPSDMDFFSQELFIVNGYRTDRKFLINRNGDTLLPQPIVTTDTTIIPEYSRIFKASGQEYICYTGQREKHIYTVGEGIRVEAAQQTPQIKTIPWSEEKLEARKNQYYNQRRGRGLSRFRLAYDLKIRNTDPKKWRIQDGVIVMQKDTISDEQKDKMYMGEYLFYINKEGKTVLELPADIVFAGYFSEGMAPAITKEQKLGFIDREGKWVIQPKYDFSFGQIFSLDYFRFPTFKEGYAFIPSYGYINKEGKEFFSSTGE